MAELNVYITTFNCARQPLHIDYFAHHLLNSLDRNSALPPDLIVLCLQELAPLGYSFLGGSFLTPYFLNFTRAVQQATTQRFGRDGDYARLVVRNVGMTAIMVFARAKTEEKVRWIESGGVGVGLWEMGNKGAVGVRLGLGFGADDSEEVVPLTFVAAHLAPMEEAYQRRNQDWRSICEGLIFQKGKASKKAKMIMEGGSEAEPLLSSVTDGVDDDNKTGPHGIFSPISQVFFAGDLNYRTSDTRPVQGDDNSWPQPAHSAESNSHYSNFLERDQLTRERQNKKTLHLLTESPIDFPPTYKYSDAAQKEALRKASALPLPSEIARHQATASDQSEDTEDDVWLWAKHRFPSWCDRVLYLDESPPKVHSYTALPLQPTSDHRPVALSFSITAKVPDAVLKPPFAIRKDWEERRAAARRYEVVVGLAAYLALTWEGEALLAGTIIGILGGYVALRAMLDIWI